ncbi:N-acetyl-alpha-D-glucosaminyl L-malate synthase [bacterium HR10]|uniref:Glycosyl transferase family 1 n=1 Tax=uncultured Acidobacteriota bacterium TaxID=171953 RepID=H5SIV6_9BACT|nr:glycosyl transferase family 1 [uncultured Acidobacteriota bacterium]GBC82472.1 N-acetyl-alpha-D-glucosaminyl L-malate synthase [bacterium HR10]
MRRPSSIIFVLPVGERGGAESVFFEIVRGLDRARFAPLVVFLRDGPFVREVQDAGIPVHLRPITRLRDPFNYGRAVEALRRVFLRQEARLVISSHGYGHLYGGVAAWLARLPAVWWQHGIASAEHHLDRVAVRIPARGIIVSSFAAAEAHRRVFGASGAPLRVIHPGVDVERFRSPNPERLARIREEWRVDRFRYLVSAIGRLEPGKGYDCFLHAARLLGAEMPDVGFLIVGGEMEGARSGYAASLRGLVAALGLNERVIFAGFRREIPEVLAMSHLLVHAATRPESFGVVLCEAMAAGRPVIATDLGGAREIVVPGETGLLVPPGDPPALAEAMGLLLRDGARRRMMGEAARARVRMRFTARRMVAHFEQFLDELLVKLQGHLA